MRPDQLRTKAPSPRWACPECKSTAVQIALPTWYNEDDDGLSQPVSIDEESEPLYWYCEGCQESGTGSPVDLL